MANSDVIASCKTEVSPALQYRHTGKRRANSRGRIVGRAIVNDDERQALIHAFCESAKALNGMCPTVPVQDDASYLGFEIQCALACIGLLGRTPQSNVGYPAARSSRLMTCVMKSHPAER